MTPRGDLAFEAFADPTRRAILSLLAARGESAAGEIASEVDTVGRTAISAHLRVLRAAGLVRERREGRHRLYALEPEAADALVDFLATLYRTFTRGPQARHSAKESDGDGGACTR